MRTQSEYDAEQMRKRAALLEPFRTPFDPRVESHTLPVYGGKIVERMADDYGPVFDLTLHSASEDGTEQCFTTSHPERARMEAVLAIWRAYPLLVHELAMLEPVQPEG